MNNELVGKVVVAFPSTGHDISSRWLRSLVEMDVYDRVWLYSCQVLWL